MVPVSITFTYCVNGTPYNEPLKYGIQICRTSIHTVVIKMFMGVMTMYIFYVNERIGERYVCSPKVEEISMDNISHKQREELEYILLWLQKQKISPNNNEWVDANILVLNEPVIRGRPVLKNKDLDLAYFDKRITNPLLTEDEHFHTDSSFIDKICVIVPMEEELINYYPNIRELSGWLVVPKFITKLIGKLRTVIHDVPDSRKLIGIPVINI